MKLYLIAGHGAGDVGAVGNGYQEAERVRALCSRIKALGGDSVVYLDPNRNWYADNGISSLDIPDSDCLLECHLDSASPSARGGHVIIYKEFAPDQYDNALADMLKNMFAGRSQTIVGRDDLANPNRAMRRGINYRLVEFCFITNYDDITKFNNTLDDIARGVLQCFSIGTVKENIQSTPAPSTQNKSTIYRIRKSWDDAKSQIGAYSVLNSAISVCPDGYSVFDGNGNVVYSKTKPVASNSFTSYKVKVTTDVLNVRKGAGMSYPVVMTIKFNEVYTIVDESNGWGKLKSGAGWISLAYTTKV